jgi:hypothetical protein
MNKRFDQSPRNNAVGLAVGSIVALIVAMTISLSNGIQPIGDSTDIDVASADSIHN